MFYLIYFTLVYSLRYYAVKIWKPSQNRTVEAFYIIQNDIVIIIDETDGTLAKYRIPLNVEAARAKQKILEYIRITCDKSSNSGSSSPRIKGDETVSTSNLTS